MSVSSVRGSEVRSITGRGIAQPPMVARALPACHRARLESVLGADSARGGRVSEIDEKGYRTTAAEQDDDADRHLGRRPVHRLRRSPARGRHRRRRPSAAAAGPRRPRLPARVPRRRRARPRGRDPHRRRPGRPDPRAPEGRWPGLRRTDPDARGQARSTSWRRPPRGDVLRPLAPPRPGPPRSVATRSRDPARTMATAFSISLSFVIDQVLRQVLPVGLGRDLLHHLGPAEQVAQLVDPGRPARPLGAHQRLVRAPASATACPGRGLARRRRFGRLRPASSASASRLPVSRRSLARASSPAATHRRASAASARRPTFISS